jgi:hypothetical protein
MLKELLRTKNPFGLNTEDGYEEKNDGRRENKGVF